MGAGSERHEVGILGGGQLGLMLVEASEAASCRCRLLDADLNAPASRRATVVAGDIRDADDVARFGAGCGVVTIEIEAVSVPGLERLVAAGVAVFPQPDIVARVQDKGLQKQWLEEAGFPTSAFRLFDGPADLEAAVAAGRRSLPFVQKTRRAGYDGRGVLVVRTTDDLDVLLDGPCLAEDCVVIAQELSVIVARNTHGAVVVYDPVEMRFREEGNILDLLLCPADVGDELAQQATTLARDVAEKLGIVGVLAVEMFVDRQGELWVNEIAPRPHNSGHHTIELCETSQYEQHLRAVTGQPLGSPARRGAAVLLNVLGKPGHHGVPHYVGVEKLRAVDGVHVHLYGKPKTWPLRKMGHVTIVRERIEDALEVATTVRPWLEVQATP